MLDLHACSATADLEPLVIRGLILHRPFSGGFRRTKSEVRLFNNPSTLVNGADLLWELALTGTTSVATQRLGRDQRSRRGLKSWGGKVVVAGGGGDSIIDQQRELAAELEAKGMEGVGLFGGEGDYHGVEMLEPVKVELLFEKLKGII